MYFRKLLVYRIRTYLSVRIYTLGTQGIYKKQVYVCISVFALWLT